MARLYFNIWPFISTKICPMAHKISQRRSKILPNDKLTLKTKDIAKSGHTGCKSHLNLKRPTVDSILSTEIIVISWYLMCSAESGYSQFIILNVFTANSWLSSFYLIHNYTQLYWVCSSEYSVILEKLKVQLGSFWYIYIPLGGIWNMRSNNFFKKSCLLGNYLGTM